MISIVIPAHNEELLLERTVRDIVEGLRAGAEEFELLVVENGSRDGTVALARRLETELPEVRLLSLPEPDYGAALRVGILAAVGDLVGVFDADLYDLGFLRRALADLRGVDGPAIVLGSKRAPGAEDRRPLPRRVVTATFCWVLRAGFGLHTSDTHGMKVLAREPLRDVVVACRQGKDLFDSELVLRAERAGLRIDELPVVVEELRPPRSSIARRAARTLGGLARLRLGLWRDARRQPGG